MMNIIKTENLYIAATSSTPRVDFQFENHHLSLDGESYPENASSFYRPLIEQVEQYLTQLRVAEQILITEVHVSLVYFNSSSTKMLFTLFDILNKAASEGLSINFHWYADKEDDISQEFGEELHADFQSLNVHHHILE
ncbi:MAG: DUF1987 domain-containing protein [Rouxiella aceris]|uniref:DUF1987 domain-containing protein n=1 Tax=Rouxiella aceris TaxID=2703884 RepID=UPI0028488B3F|nr:DUF1987 domain-containing protein [Rouxiella aceris]MDR3434005.1 DUF1987 domain-containing protein [Rouxiella aceris]